MGLSGLSQIGLAGLSQIGLAGFKVGLAGLSQIGLTGFLWFTSSAASKTVAFALPVSTGIAFGSAGSGHPRSLEAISQNHFTIVIVFKTCFTIVIMFQVFYNCNYEWNLFYTCKCNSEEGMITNRIIIQV